MDEEPPIRANTTILLGNLAPHLSEATCKRVMLNAFTRALKDSFPPARSAGLKVAACLSDMAQSPFVLPLPLLFLPFAVCSASPVMAHLSLRLHVTVALIGLYPSLSACSFLCNPCYPSLLSLILSCSVLMPPDSNKSLLIDGFAAMIM